MKKFLLPMILLGLLIPTSLMAGSLIDRTKGRIVLQVEEVGQAWYVNPETGLRSYMKDGDAAYELMRFGGLGISNFHLEGIPVENDVHEIKNKKSVCPTNTLANSVKGKILLQVESVGEAWYVFPENCYRIYMKDGEAAYQIMRFLGLGITNNDLNQIPQPTGATEEKIRGSVNASIKIIEYCDLEGPFCQRVQETLDQLFENYPKEIQLEFRHFPLSFHENAQKAAEASECAADQGKFWEYHDVIFGNQELLKGGALQLKSWATTLGLDRTQFDGCLDSGEKAHIVAKEIELGEKDGVSGTPTFFINGTQLTGAQPYTAFATIIDDFLGGTKSDDFVENSLIVTSDDHIFGAINAPVTIIEYGDFECPFCQRAHETLQQLLNDYSGKVRHIYRHFPLSSIHEYAQKAAEASECAADQGEFWLYHDIIYGNQSLLSGGIPQLKQWASDIGLNRAQFDACLDSGVKKVDVLDDKFQGEVHGVTGTPGFLINGELLHGALPYEQFAEIIERHLP